MCQWVLQPLGQVIARSTVRPLTVAESNSKLEEEKQKIFLQNLHKNIGKAHKHASDRKENIKPYEDNEDSSDSDPDLEATVCVNKEVK